MFDFRFYFAFMEWIVLGNVGLVGYFDLEDAEGPRLTSGGWRKELLK